MSTNNSNTPKMSKEEVEAKKAEAQKMFDEAQEALRKFEREEREAKQAEERIERERIQAIKDEEKKTIRNQRASLLLEALHAYEIPAAFDMKAEYRAYGSWDARFELAPGYKGWVGVSLGFYDGNDTIVLEHREHYPTVSRGGYGHRYFKEIRHTYKFGKKGFDYNKIAKTTSEELQWFYTKEAEEKKEVNNKRASTELAHSLIVATKIGRHNPKLSIGETEAASDKVVVALRAVTLNAEEAIALVEKLIELGLVEKATAKEVAEDKAYFKQDN